MTLTNQTFMILRLLKVILTLIVTLFAIILVGIGATLSITTVRSEQHPNQLLFESGQNQFILTGNYNAASDIKIPNWTGKSFANHNFNLFTNSIKKYPFRLTTSRGLRDANTEVWRTDYNLQGNPWGLRLFFVEEIVTTENNHLLGKMHIRIMPNLTFTIGYFELTPVK